MSNEFVVKKGIKIPTETASTVPYLDANKKITSSAVTPTELGYVSGVTSAVQTQLNAKATTTGKLDQFAATTSAELAGVISDETGSGLLVFATSPVLTTPNIGAATATSVNSTTIPSSKTLVVTTDKLSALAATTSSELAGVISDETGSGALVFGTSPTLTTPSTDIITLDGQAATPANPSTGFYKAYVKDSTQKLTILDSSGVETTVGSGSGTNNYITATDGTTIGDWATYADAAASSPVDGTGGSPASTFAVSTSSTLRGTTNFLFTHSAANRQGEGFSYLMAIDPSDRGKVLRLSFDYLVASGTYADNDLVIYFYDATNAALIQPAPYQIKNSGIIERFNSEVQIPRSCASLRVIFHVATSTATAYTMRFDDFVFAQQAKLYGSPVTDWVSYTPTYGAGLGTTTSAYALWRRNGDSIEVYGRFTTGTVSGSAATVSLPTGITIDSAKITASIISGWADVNNSATTTMGYSTIAIGAASTISFGQRTSTASLINASITGTPFGNTTVATYYFKAPITGWSSSQIMSNDADTRVITARYSTNAGQTISDNTATIIDFEDLGFDDVNAVTTGASWKYTAKVPGKYRVSATILINAAIWAAGDYQALDVYKNGAMYANIARNTTESATSQYIKLTSSTILNLIAGDYIDIRLIHDNAANTSKTLITSNDHNFIEIERISGPSQIMASDTVSALYTGAPPTGTIDTTFNNIITFGTKVKDSTGSYSSGSYTIPISGIYAIGASVDTTHASITAAQYVGLTIAIDGTARYTRYSYAQTTNVNVFAQVDINSVPLLAGQVVTIRVQSTGTTPAFNASATTNNFYITRTGNY